MEQRATALELSIVVPVYRSERILPELAAQVRAALLDDPVFSSYELILVNDCSPDGSWAVIERLSKEDLSVKGINLRKNAGQHNAVMAGLAHATGNIVIMMDDDLQHPPRYLPILASQIKNGLDVCYTRYRERKHALWKKAGSWLNDRAATWLLKKPKGVYLSSFKAIDRGVRNEVVRYEGPYPYVDGLILLSTNNIGTIDIDHQDRFEGQGNYNLTKSISLWLKMATSFSVLPLRFASLMGIFLSVASVIVAVAVLTLRLVDPSIAAGWTSLIATVLFVGGIQLLAIGAIGEYLGRAYLNLNRRPQFVIKSKTWDQQSTHGNTIETSRVRQVR